MALGQLNERDFNYVCLVIIPRREKKMIRQAFTGQNEDKVQPGSRKVLKKARWWAGFNKRV